MAQYAGRIFLFLTFFVLLFSSFHIISYSQGIILTQPKVVYDLPYPGLLPDSPLYFIKAIRDKLLDILTRDYQKKADLHLLFSDKRAAMAIELTEKGKDKLALTTLSKGEKYALRIPPLLETSKKQGVSPNADFVLKAKLSNTKHREIIESFLMKLSQGQAVQINEILKINEDVRKGLEKF